MSLDALLEKTASRLQDREANYKDLFDSATDAIFILDMDGHFIDVNKTAYSRLGYSKDEMLAMHISQLETPDSASKLQGHMEKVRELGSLVFESAHVRKDGSVMPVEVNCRLHEYAGRQIYLSFIRDVTDRQKAEELLRRSEDCYRRFSAMTSDYVYSCFRSGDGPFRVQWMAGAIAEITGYSYDDIMAWGCWMPIVHPDDIQRVSSCLMALVPGESSTSEFRIIRKDGAIRWVHEACSCQQGLSPGERLLLGTCRDITKKKEVEASLQEVETIFNLFLEHSPIYVFFKDENVRATRLSRNYEKMLGLPLDQILGKNMEDIFPSEFARKMVADDLKVLRDMKPIEIEEEFLGRTYKTHKFPIALKGRSTLLAGFTVDITDLKKAQQEVLSLNKHLERLVEERTAELARINEELAGFCYAVSHELRAPIARLQGFSAVLTDLSKGGDEYSALAARIMRANKQLQSVVDALLLLNRLSRKELSLQLIDLSEMASRKAKLLLAENPERRLELVIEPGITAVADPDMMEICLDNLIGNAFKYTGQSPVACIELGSLSDAGNKVYFVRDNGAGFDMAYSEKLYTPFQRLHQHKDFPGLGIGLATVKRIIERHGGEIWADSRVGEGATFYFTLGGKG